MPIFTVYIRFFCLFNPEKEKKRKKELDKRGKR